MSDTAQNAAAVGRNGRPYLSIGDRCLVEKPGRSHFRVIQIPYAADAVNPASWLINTAWTPAWKARISTGPSARVTTDPVVVVITNARRSRQTRMSCEVSHAAVPAGMHEANQQHEACVVGVHENNSVSFTDPLNRTKTAAINSVFVRITVKAVETTTRRCAVPLGVLAIVEEAPYERGSQPEVHHAGEKRIGGGGQFDVRHLSGREHARVDRQRDNSARRCATLPIP